MNFFDFIKKFLIFTLKEIYSFFLKMSLFFIFLFLISASITTFFITKNIKDSKISEDYSYVLFNPSNITEDKIDNFSLLSNFSDSEKYNISFSDILNSLDEIKNNNGIKGIIINLDQVQLSSSKIEEFSKKFKELKEKGKKIYAIGAYIENSNYNLAVLADEIITFPSASSNISLTGYHYSDLYYKELFNRLGINMEVVKIGDFKSYGENYTSNTMSDGLKNELTRILDKRFNTFVKNISTYRKIPTATLEKDIVDGNITNLSPFTARDKNLVDNLEYWADFLTRTKISEDEIIDIYDYYNLNKKAINASIKKGSGTIAVIYAEGSIQYESNSNNSIMITPDNIGKKIEKVLEIPDLEGIVLRVNSPGGSALASEIIYQSFSKLKIPIYVSMGDTAASGGYYISMAGNKIFADNATITGSIGVVSMIPKLANTNTKYGITSNTITKGKYSDIYDAFSPLSEESKVKISQSMEETYKEFKSRVTKNRQITSDELENYAQGKIWLGEEAKEIKLVDNIASLDETIKILAKDLNLGDEYNIENIYLERSFSETIRALSSFVLEKFNIISSVENSLLGTNKISEEYKLFENNKNMPLYYMPYKLDF